MRSTGASENTCTTCSAYLIISTSFMDFWTVLSDCQAFSLLLLLPPPTRLCSGGGLYVCVSEMEPGQ